MKLPGIYQAGASSERYPGNFLESTELGPVLRNTGRHFCKLTGPGAVFGNAGRYLFEFRVVGRISKGARRGLLGVRKGLLELSGNFFGSQEYSLEFTRINRSQANSGQFSPYFSKFVPARAVLRNAPEFIGHSRRFGR